MPDTTAASSRRAPHSSFCILHSAFCIVHCAFCISVFAALAANALAYTWTGNAGDGVLNTPENWDPVLPNTPISARWSTLTIPLPNDGSAAAFTLTAPLTANLITFSGGAADAAPTVFDLGGTFLRSTNSAAQLNFAASTPLIFRNGSLVSGSTTYFGVNGNKASPVSLTLDHVALRGGAGSYYSTNLFVSVKDGALTNALHSVPSHTRIVLDNTSVYVDGNGNPSPCAPGSTASNVSFRAVNGSLFVAGHSARRFTIGGRGNRYAVESGSNLGIPNIITGHDNWLGVTNAVISTAVTSGTDAPCFTIQGTNNAVTFKSAVAGLPKFKQKVFTVSGLNNRLVFEDSAVTNDETSISQSIENTISGRDNIVTITGSSASFYLGALGIYGSNNVFAIADNLVISNKVSSSLKMHGYPMNPLFKAGSVDCSFVVGKNAVAEFWHWNGIPMGATNMLFKIGPGSSVRTVKQDTDKGSTTIGGAFGHPGRIVLDNASFTIVEGQRPTIVTGNVEIAILGDAARFSISSSGSNSAYGQLHVTGVREGNAPPRLIFRPGPTGYGGTAPISPRNTGSSILAPTTVFEVNASDFAHGKPTGIYEIPLIKKGKNWKQCNLDALNAVGVFTPANGKLVANADNDIVFRFKRDCGTRLMVR